MNTAWTHEKEKTTAAIMLMLEYARVCKYASVCSCADTPGVGCGLEWRRQHNQKPGNTNAPHKCLTASSSTASGKVPLSAVSYNSSVCKSSHSSMAYGVRMEHPVHKRRAPRDAACANQSCERAAPLC